MSYISLTTNEIATGMPVASNSQTKIKNNFDNHETRIQTLEVGGNIDYPPIIMRVNGLYEDLGATTNILKTVCNFNLTITGVRIYVDQAGSSGTLTCDIKVSHSGGAYTSILTTLPSVSYTAGNDAVSTNAVLDVTKVNISSGDIIRLDTTSSQTYGNGFMVRIDYNKS